MNNSFRLIVFILSIISAGVMAQDKALERSWESQKDAIQYRKKRNYNGPTEWYSSSPAQMEKGFDTEGDDGSLYVPDTYTEEQIQKEREQRYGKKFSEHGGKMKENKVLPPEPIEIPEFDPPEFDPPDIDLPDVDAPDWFVSAGFWKTLLFILLFAVLIIIAYYIIKNRKPKDVKVLYDLEDDWAPERIEKSELELLLEEAMNNKNYRAAVRIYFMFILKDLSEKNLIKWKKDKTNYHYLLELRSHHIHDDFNSVVRIYDLVWYGDYQIGEAEFSQVQPTLVHCYQKVQIIHG